MKMDLLGCSFASCIKSIALRKTATDLKIGIMSQKLFKFNFKIATEIELGLFQY
jgi:hypothetical protein